MSDGLLIALYALAAIVTFVPLVRWWYADEVARQRGRIRPQKVSRAECVAGALFVAAFWPVVWVGVLAWGSCELLGRLLLPEEDAR